MKRLLVSVVMIFFLFGCGGSGGGSSPANLSPLALGGTGEDPVKNISSKNEKPSNKIDNDSDNLLENLKKQHFKSNVKIVDLPEDEFYVSIEEFSTSPVPIYYDLDIGVASISAEKPRSKELKEGVYIVDQSYNLILKESKGDSYYFETLGYNNFYNGGSSIFLKFNFDGYEVAEVSSNKGDEIVYHLYEDKKTFGLMIGSEVDFSFKLNNPEGLVKEFHFYFDTFDWNKYYGGGVSEPGVITTVDDGANVSLDSSSTPTSADANSGDSSTSESTGTNNQVEGVEEEDKVKIVGDIIYFLRDNKIIGFHTKDKTEISYEVEDFEIVLDYGYYKYSYYPDYKFQVIGDYLVLIVNGETLDVSFLNISNGIELFKKYSFNGQSVSSRVINEKLYLIHGEGVYPDKEIKGLRHFAFTEKQQEEFEAKNNELLAGLTLIDFNIDASYKVLENGVSQELSFDLNDNIKFPENSGGSFFAKINTFDANGEIEGFNSILIDYVENIYVTKTTLYLYLSSWVSNTIWWEDFWSGENKTMVYSFDLLNDLQFTGAGEVNGHPVNSFAFHEKNEYLFVATHTWSDEDNQLSVLKNELGAWSFQTELDGLAKGERIQSVRYNNDKAYIVTFRQTDPLFVIDISDPTNISLKGELKINGFSSYLHPIFDDILLGVGVAASEEGRVTGAKVTTFNVADDSNPFEIQSAEFGTRESSLYPGFDHHTFTWIPWMNTAAIIGRSDYYSESLILVKFDEAGAITGLAEIKNDSYSEYQYYYAYGRSIAVNNEIFYISNGNIKVSDLSAITFSTDASTIFGE